MTATAEEIDYSQAFGNGPKADEMDALSWACVALGAERRLDYVRARRALQARARWPVCLSIDRPCAAAEHQPCALPTGSIDEAHG